MIDWIRLIIDASMTDSGRFWVQVGILVALVVVVAPYAILRVVQLVKAGVFDTQAHTVETYQQAMKADEELLESLKQTVAQLQAEVAAAKGREAGFEARLDAMQARHKREMDGMAARFEARIAELEARLENFECIIAPGCPNRKRRIVTEI